MASWHGILFDEILTAETPRMAMATDPDIRYLASGGSTLTAAATETGLAIEVLCSPSALGQLRTALVNGTVDDVDLDGETVPSQQLVSIGPPVAHAGCDDWRVPLTFAGVDVVVTPKIGVTIGSVLIGGILGISTSVGRNARFATATVTTTEPRGTRGDAVAIYGVAGGATVALFKGTLETIDRASWPDFATITCSGTLKRLQREWPFLEDYTGQDDASMIRNLIEKRDGLHSIESSGWILGQKRPVQVQPRDTFIQWVDDVDRVARYRTYDRHDGAVYRRRDDWVMTDAPTHTLTEGHDILSISQGENYDSIRNAVWVEGLVQDGAWIVTVVSAASPELDAMMPGTAPNYNTETIKSDLIEVIEHANGVAAMQLYDLNRVQKWLEVSVPFDPELVVDDCVQVIAPSIGVDAVAMIWDVKHQVDGEGGTTTITTNRGSL